MTVAEAIRSYPALNDISENLINQALLDRNLSGATSYSSAIKRGTDLTAADLMLLVATNPKIREGQFSIEYTPAELKAFAKAIYDEYDDPKADRVFSQPTVRNASSQW